MLLPETLLLAGLIMICGALVNTASSYRPGQQAMASNTLASEAMQGHGANLMTRRQQRQLQGQLQNHPDNLLNLTGDEVVQAFSYADLQRREGNTLILQFRGQECVLDIYFSNDKNRMDHYEFRARQMAVLNQNSKTQKINARHCIGDIIKSRRI